MSDLGGTPADRVARAADAWLSAPTTPEAYARFVRAVEAWRVSMVEAPSAAEAPPTGDDSSDGDDSADGPDPLDVAGIGQALAGDPRDVLSRLRRG